MQEAIGSNGSPHPAPLPSASSVAPPGSPLLLPTQQHISPAGGRSSTTQLPQVEPANRGVMALSSDPNYKKLDEWYRANGSSLRMRDMFEQDKDRFCKFRLGEPCESGRDGGGEGDGRWA